jgi:hypothetical protein
VKWLSNRETKFCMPELFVRAADAGVHHVNSDAGAKRVEGIRVSPQRSVHIDRGKVPRRRPLHALRCVRVRGEGEGGCGCWRSRGIRLWIDPINGCQLGTKCPILAQPWHPAVDKETRGGACVERRADTTEMTILLKAASYGPNGLFCMPTRSKCVLLGFSDATGT